MPLRLLTACGVAAAVVLCAAVPASAHHQATVSASATSLTLDPPKCGPSELRHVSRCDGVRRARVTWSGTCGTSQPYVSVDFFATRAGGGNPIRLATEQEDLQTSGVTTTLLEPGAHVYATVTMDCLWDDPEGTGPDAHTVTVTSAPTGRMTVRPWLREVNDIKNNFCNFNPGSRTLLQAGQRGAILDFSTDFIDRSLLGVSRRKPAGVRQVWVNAKGAGIRKRRHPEMSLLMEFGRREPVSGALRVNPRRAGWLKLWAEVGGVRTNSLAIRVVPNRC
jgi:hypothetical protein